MKEIVILMVAFIGLALAIEVVYVMLKIAVDKAYTPKEPEEEKEEPSVFVIKDDYRSDLDFDLGVKVDKVRFGDEE